MHRFFSQGFECAFHQNDVQNLLFGVKNVIRHDKIQLHVLTYTRITGEAVHTREHFALIVELPLILFLVGSTTLSRQHVEHLRTVMQSLQIVYLKTRRSRSDNLILRQG